MDGYSVKEVIERRFDEMGEHLVEIKEQVKKTNGRVGSLERTRAKMWGSIGMLTFLGGAMIYLSIAAIEAKIDLKVKSAIAQYEIEN